MPTLDICKAADTDRQFYQENGYWISPRIIGEEQIRKVIEHMDMIYDDMFETGREPLRSWKKGESDPGSIRKVDNAWWADLTIRELAFNQAIGEIASKLAGTPSVRMWHDQLLYKPGGGDTKGNVGWHQDYGYWQCTYPADMLTAWIALVDVDEQNGCMQFVPGSHRWGLYQGGMNFFEQDRQKQITAICSPDGSPVEPVSATMERGQVSFHHCLTLHGSGPNLTEQPRRSLVIHLLPEHVRYRANSPSDAHSNVALLGGKDGDLWRGSQFQLIYPADSTSPEADTS